MTAAAVATEPVIRVRGLVKRYGDVKAVDGIDFEVAAGEVFGLLGPNGAVMGAVTFLALGYVIASFASTEDAANGMTSVIQFPMMFLSGTFFPIDQMPDVLKVVARVIPLTYLSDALRQVTVGGAAFAPLWTCFLVLGGWLVVCFGIASRKFRWQ